MLSSSCACSVPEGLRRSPSRAPLAFSPDPSAPAVTAGGDPAAPDGGESATCSCWSGSGRPSSSEPQAGLCRDRSRGSQTSGPPSCSPSRWTAGGLEPTGPHARPLSASGPILVRKVRSGGPVFPVWPLQPSLCLFPQGLTGQDGPPGPKGAPGERVSAAARVWVPLEGVGEAPGLWCRWAPCLQEGRGYRSGHRVVRSQPTKPHTGLWSLASGGPQVHTGFRRGDDSAFQASASWEGGGRGSAVGFLEGAPGGQGHG